jgi:glycosyltransferase involved in cell wall biosynthesis
MNNNFPKISVMIPVKDRAEYLYHTLRTCMSQSYENVEFVVADDHSTDNTIEMVEGLMKIDKRIKLIKRPERLGMLINFEDALNQLRGDYVIALGGDDGLMPDALNELAEKIVKTHADLITWVPPIYEYPTPEKKNGMLRLNIKKEVDHTVSSKEFLARLTKTFLYIIDKECPMFYVKAIASMDLIKRVKSRTEGGRFYSCPTPDGYSGIVLAGEVKEYCFSAKPYTIFGTSPSSQGKAYLSNDEKAKEYSREFYKFVSKESMHKELASQPYSPLITLMTVDYLLTAKDLPGWKGEVPPIDYKDMLAHAVLELSRNGYGSDRIGREIEILYKIADYHGLTEYLSGLLEKSKRRGINDIKLENIISFKYFYLNAKFFDVHNIYDASYMSKYFLTIRTRYSLKGILRSFLRSVKLFFINRKVIGDFKSFIR